MAKVKVEVALDDPDPSVPSANYTWTDWTSAVELDGGAGVQTFRGYRDGSGEVSPTEIRFRGKNADLRWSLNNPNNPYYGRIIKRRTPIRVSRVDGGTTVRAFGILEESISGTADAGAYRFADVTAFGRLHVLDEEPEGNSVLYDQLVPGPNQQHVVAYWPGEDPSGATRLRSAVPGGADITTMVGITPGGDSSVLGSKGGWTIQGSGYVIASVPAYARLYPERWGVLLAIKAPVEPAGTQTFLCVYPTSGTVWRWVLQIIPGSPATLNIRAEDTAGTNLLTGTTVTSFTDIYGNEPWGRTVGIELSVTQNGTGIDWSIRVVASQDAFNTGLGQAGTLAAATHGPVGTVNTGPLGGPDGWTMAHWAVFNEPGQMDFVYFNGQIGQTLTSEFLTAAIDAGVDVYLPGSTVSTTGARPIANPAARMRLAARSEGGLLFERPDGAVGLITRDLLQNQAVALTINRANKQVGSLTIVDDMQSQSNRCTASNASGSSIVVDAPSPYDPATVGWARDAPISVNLENDAQLLGAAQLAVALASYPEPRYLIELHLEGPASGLKAAYLSTTVDIGSRIQLTNPPTYEVLDTIDQQIMGITERMTEKEYDVTLNTRPAAVWQVMTAETGAGNASRADTAGSILLADLGSAGTSAIVATDGRPGEPTAKWSTTSLPYDLALRTYDRVTCTAVTNNAPTFVAAGTSAAADYGPVTPGVPAGMTAGDGLFLLAAVRGTGGSAFLTGVSGRYAEISGDQAGWTTLANFGGVNGSFRLYGRQYASGFAAPTLTPFGGAAGDTVIAQMAGFRYTQALAHTAAVPMANASAANIAYPLNGIVRTGTVTLLCLQKDDDWTSVTAPAGFTLIGSPSSTLGSDMGIAWFYQIQTSPAADIPAGTATVVGGASAISLATIVTLCGDAQTLTLTRAVNGAVTAHPAGSDVRLWRAGRGAR